MNDSDLVNRFVAGDVAAFNTLVRRWEKTIYNFILRYLSDREAAQEGCQKTFIRAYQNLHRLRDTDRLSTWLHQIAVNICKDDMRSRSRRKSVSLDQLLAQSDHTFDPATHDHGSNPEECAAANRVNALLNAALQEIPKLQRAVVIMKEYQGLKFSEIAATLAISENTAKSRMYYGLKALRKVFEKWEIDKESLEI